ncbi:MAG: ComF family protein [Lachnospiraceae bacterium]|nr:ComF family protein [Lachnospiraceae bacterium]
MCGKPTGYGKDLIHKECREKLPYITGAKCLKCGKSVENAEVEFCYDCTKTEHIYDKGRCLYSHNGQMKKSLYDFKYKNKREYAKAYGEELVNNLKYEILAWNADVIMPVPLHKSKLRHRGYNQAELIARELSRRLEIPMDSKILKRTRKTRAQKELNDSDRKKNVKNAFIVDKSIVKYKKVILVDDIYTTGSTIDSCAKVLKEKGVEKVYYVSLSVGTGI